MPSRLSIEAVQPLQLSAKTALYSVLRRILLLNFRILAQSERSKELMTIWWSHLQVSRPTQGYWLTKPASKHRVSASTTKTLPLSNILQGLLQRLNKSLPNEEVFDHLVSQLSLADSKTDNQNFTWLSLLVLLANGKQTQSERKLKSFENSLKNNTQMVWIKQVPSTWQPRLF